MEGVELKTDSFRVEDFRVEDFGFGVQFFGFRV